MEKGIKKCRVCGTAYEYCRSIKTADGVFRWQDVACSVDCGVKYLEMIRKSRGENDFDNKEESEEKEVSIEPKIVEPKKISRKNTKNENISTSSDTAFSDNDN